MIKIAQISRSHYEESKGERVNWLDQFAEAFSKTSVQPYEKEEIPLSKLQNQVLGRGVYGKTVESVVKEYNDKIGLNEYLKTISQRKVASSAEEIFPEVDKNLRDKIINFIRNNVETHRGKISVPAIQYDVLNTFKNNGITDTDVNEPGVASFISEVIAYEDGKNQRFDNSVDLGRGVGIEIDRNDNADALKGLMPATGSGLIKYKKEYNKRINYMGTNLYNKVMKFAQDNFDTVLLKMARNIETHINNVLIDQAHKDNRSKDGRDLPYVTFTFTSSGYYGEKNNIPYIRYESELTMPEESELFDKAKQEYNLICTLLKKLVKINSKDKYKNLSIHLKNKNIPNVKSYIFTKDYQYVDNV
jgi:hypothetical protein